MFDWLQLNQIQHAAKLKEIDSLHLSTTCNFESSQYMKKQNPKVLRIRKHPNFFQISNIKMEDTSNTKAPNILSRQRSTTWPCWLKTSFSIQKLWSKNRLQKNHELCGIEVIGEINPAYPM